MTWRAISTRPCQKGKGAAARVYRAAYPQSTQGKNPLELVGVLAGLPGELVGGDMTPDGDELLLKSDGEVMYFRRGAASVVGPGRYSSPRHRILYRKRGRGGEMRVDDKAGIV